MLLCATTHHHRGWTCRRTSEEHLMDQEPPASIQHIITSISTSIVEVIEKMILRDLIQPTMATGSIQLITTATNPYPPQHPSNVSYPANQSAPVMSSLRPPAQNSQNQVIQTHIFAPVVTGALTKKTKFPNMIQAGSGSRAGLPGMSF